MEEHPIEKNPTFVIKSVSGRVIFESFTALNVKDCLAEAIAAGSDLSYSDLSYSNLRGSDLRGSNLSYSNLRGSDLSGSNLSYSNLRGSNLHDEIQSINPYSITGMGPWHIIISRNSMMIGCQTHTHQKWSEFSDRVIDKMDSDALMFWKESKEILLALCAKHKSKSDATPVPD